MKSGSSLLCYRYNDRDWLTNERHLYVTVWFLKKKNKGKKQAKNKPFFVLHYYIWVCILDLDQVHDYSGRNQANGFFFCAFNNTYLNTPTRRRDWTYLINSRCSVNTIVGMSFDTAAERPDRWFVLPKNNVFVGEKCSS